QSDPYRGASNLAGRSGSEPVKPRNAKPAWNGVREFWECRAGGQTAKAMSTSKFWNISMLDSPGSERTACQEGMCSESSEPLAGRLALQLPFLQVSESMGNHDSKIVDAASV